MGIDIILRNQVHKQVELVHGDAWNVFAKIVDRSPRGSMLWQIHPHADTMFNMSQLELLVGELAELSPLDEKESEVLAALRSAAESAVRQHGYLWFSGD